MIKKPTTLETIAVRRKTVVDADRVRYRVYSSPTEYVAVIAESALVAVKLAGVRKPHRIVRDLPAEGIAIEAKRMAEIEDVAENRVVLSAVPSAAFNGQVNEFMPQKPPEKEARFKPMMLGDLQRREGNTASIVPQELLNEIIEEHVRAHPEKNRLEQPKAAEMKVAPQPQATLPPPPEPEQMPYTSAAPAVELPTPPRPEPEPQPKAQPAPMVKAEEEDRPLSQEEVEKLLNG